MANPNWYKGWDVVTYVGESQGLVSGWLRKEVRLPNSSTAKVLNFYVRTDSPEHEAIMLLETALFALEDPRERSNGNNS